MDADADVSTDPAFKLLDLLEFLFFRKLGRRDRRAVLGSVWLDAVGGGIATPSGCGRCD